MSLGVRFAAWPRPLARRLLPALRYLNLMRALELRRLAPWVPSVAGRAVLDVGCGHGLYTLDLARRGARVAGCDLHGPSLAAARVTARELGLADRTLYFAADAASLPLPTGKFDLVVCNCVLEHVAADAAALQAMARCLRPGGILYLSVDNADHGLALRFLDWLPGPFRRWFLRPEVAAASTASEGLDRRLDALYAVLRRYHAPDLVRRLGDLGLTIVDTHPYLSGIGAAHFEAFHALRGLDPAGRVGRWLYMLSSLLLYPWAAWSDRRRSARGHGLILVARREGGAR